MGFCVFFFKCLLLPSSMPAPLKGAFSGLSSIFFCVFLCVFLQALGQECEEPASAMNSSYICLSLVFYTV